MAPMADSHYFPALDKCLAGEIRLISWRTAYRALCDEASAVESSHLEHFLNDPDTLAVLSNPLEPFAKPSPTSARDFDSKTAPINISQDLNRDYNLDELKKDTKWLSGEVQIEELAALRIAIIEWQERSADQLLLTAMNGNITSTVSADPASSAIAEGSFNASATRIPPLPSLDFANEETRQRRLLDVYLSERGHILRVVANLTSRSAVTKNEPRIHQVGSLRENAKRTWIDVAASKIRENVCTGSRVADKEVFSLKCIQRISVLIQWTDDSSSWPKIFTVDETRAQTFVSSLFVELVEILRLLLADLYAFDGVPNAATLQAWFLAMEECSFLQEPIPYFPSMEEPQLLISIISVEILKVQLVVEEVMRSAGIETPQVTGDFYIKDDRCTKSINDTLQKAAAVQVKLAAPAVYAWSIITFVIRDIAMVHRQVRESRLEHPGPDGHVESSRRGSRGPRSDIENLYSDAISVPEWEALPNGTPSGFAISSVDHMDVFALISVLATAVANVYSSAAESDTGFICKEALLDLVRDGMPFVQYDVPVLDAILSIMDPFESSPASYKHTAMLTAKLLYDTDQFRPAVIDQALARYPYELSPMLRLFTALANTEHRHGSAVGTPVIVELLDRLSSYTQSVTVGFRDFQLVNEELNENDMFLTREIPIFSLRKELISLNPGLALPWHGQDHQPRILTVPSDTLGRFVRESQPRVLKLTYAHSGLEYLGLLLSTFLPDTELIPSAPGAELDRYSATDVVTLFSALLTASLKQQQPHQEALNVLQRLSSSLREGNDIVSVITDILETELLAHTNQNALEGSLELSTACVEFLNAVVQFSPERVWSFLGRSSLLGLADGAPSLASVVSGTEVQLHQYGFLKACLKLHKSLLEDAIAGLVKRNGQPLKTSNRFTPPAASLSSTQERNMSSVLNAYQEILLDVFQSIPNWKFDVPEDHCSITTNIAEGFTKLMKCTYGLDLSKHASKRLTMVLAPAADALLNVCAPHRGTSPIVETFTRILPEALATAEDTLQAHLRGLLLQQAKSALQFLTVLVRVTKSGFDLFAKGKDGNKRDLEPDANEDRQTKHILPVHGEMQRQAVALSSYLLTHMPLFASLLACDQALRGDLYGLLSELVHTAASSDEDPPSILARLDLEAQKSFFVVICQLDRPLCDIDVERRAWDFLSAVLSSRQQWFAVYLLTGELPKKRTHRHNSNPIKGKPILGYALDQLSHIALLSPERAIGMLKFVSAAQQSWVWATTTLRSHSEFIKSTLAWIDTLGPASRDPSPGSSIICAKEYLMASMLCDIFAVNLYASMETGDKSLLKSLTQKLSFLRDHGVSVNAYNRSLHINLTDNLKRKFPNSEMSDFKRTEVNPELYGTEYCYDREFAASVLGHDLAWEGRDRSRSQGFSDEFARANANFSLLDGQSKLLRSWKTLATTLCECAEQDAALQVELATVAEKCLLANTNPQLDEPGMADILELRAELAFVLISKLVSLEVQDGAMKDLLAAAWELVRTSPVDYDVATVPKDVRYYRELLQVLYLTIQPHIYTSRRNQGPPGEELQLQYLAPSIASTLVNIFGQVIAPGFRALCGNLHSDTALALPADFALTTALLQGILSVPGISSVYTLLSDLVAGSSVVRGALSLYSWADRLSEVTAQDPVYGEVAVMFLLALSNVRPVAEQMALEGVLTNLSSANLSNYLRKPGGKGAFDEPQRMFVIWSDGFLPLCLNLLDSVGPPVAAEVAAFLNSFPEQLSRAEKSLQNEAPSMRNTKAGSVTLGLVSEAHNLMMIGMILDSDIARGAAAGINAADVPALEYDHEKVKSLVEALTRSKRSLNDRLTAVSPLEEKWLKTQVNISGDNLLRQKVIKELDTMAHFLGSSTA